MKTEPKLRQIDALEAYNDAVSTDRGEWENADTLEENMQQILTQLRSITGENKWSDEPVVNLKSLDGSAVSGDTLYKYEFTTTASTSNLTLPSGYWYRFSADQSRTQLYFDGLMQDNDSYSEVQVGTTNTGVSINFSEALPAGITISLIYFGGTA